MSTPPKPENAAVRYHALDALRGVVLLLGVFYHAASSFEPGANYWAIIDSEANDAAHFFRFVSHSFRLEVFFIIAGFFARLLIMKRGLRDFAHNRTQRILIPLIVGWLILFPLMIAIWIIGAQKSGNFDLLRIPEKFQNLPWWQLWAGFFWSGAWLEKFHLTHLWFLYQLLVIYVLFMALRAFCLKVLPAHKWFQDVEHAALWVFQSPFRILVLAALSVPALLLMRGFDVNTPGGSLIPVAGPTLLFGLCFAVGWWLHRQSAVLPTLTSGWAATLIAGAIAVSAAWWFEDWTEALGLDGLHKRLKMILFWIVYGIALWGLSLGSLGLFLRYLRHESPFWRYIAESSYWVYIAHLPLVAALQIWVAFWPVNWVVKFALINAIALVFLYLSYHYFIRSSFIGRQLNGRSWEFQAIPPWLKKKEKVHQATQEDKAAEMGSRFMSGFRPSQTRPRPRYDASK